MTLLRDYIRYEITKAVPLGCCPIDEKLDHIIDNGYWGNAEYELVYDLQHGTGILIAMIKLQPSNYYGKPNWITCPPPRLLNLSEESIRQYKLNLILNGN